jgi:hypothetical protein
MNDLETFQLPGAGNFSFSGVGVDQLGATEYTLVTIVRDITGSMSGFEQELIKVTQAIVEACRKSPRAENLMVRVVDFNQAISEVHGFKPLSIIKTADYKTPYCNGLTALFDAAYSSIAAEVAYSETLMDQDFLVNGIVVVLTDGEDNRSSMTPRSIADLLEKVRKSEKEIESLLTVLVSFNLSGGSKALLDQFAKDATFDQYIDAGSCTPETMSKIAGFVSKSISSQSQSLGTGGPSAPIGF